MPNDLRQWLDLILAKPLGWVWQFLCRVFGPVFKPFFGTADQWAADRISSWRRSLGDRGDRWGSAEALVIAFLLVQITPLAISLVPSLFCSFKALVSLPFALPLGIQPLCAEPGLSGHAAALGSSVLASIALWAVMRWSILVVNDVQESRAKLTAVPGRPTRALIMGLSEWPGSRGGIAAAAAEAELWAGKWQEFIKPETAGGNWQQSVRRIAASIDTLEAIMVVASTQSALQFEAFKGYAETILGRGPLPIHRVKGATGPGGEASDANEDVVLDYENYDDVSAAMRRALEQAAVEVKDLLRSETCVDVTAGLKVFSIAGGVLTLNNGLTFSYVTTQPQGRAGEVRYYDAELIFADRMNRALDRVKG